MPASVPAANGLHLLFPDGHSLALTFDTIEARSRVLLADRTRIPASVLQAESFQRCSICPKHGSGDTCHAIRPVLAVWENFDKCWSYDKVTAVYRTSLGPVVVSAETTMQQALQYVSVLSLLYYCETGKKYWPYFFGVHPLMDAQEVAVRVYLNMFWACHGDIAETRALINTFHDEIMITTHCQMDRIRLFCKNDAFLNALILTQLASEFLASNVEELLAQRVESFAQSFFA